MRTRPRLSCLRHSSADNNDAVDVIAFRLRHLHYLRQVVLRATLATLIETPLQGTARQRDSKPWEGSSSSHDPSLSREAALSYSMVGMSRRRRPKFQPQSGVPARCKGSLAAQMGQRRRADPTLSCTSAGWGLVTDEVAARVSFTIETTVLPSFALRKLGRVHRPRMTQTSAAKQRLCGRG